MTILPKKKQTKEKKEGEGGEHSHSQLAHSGSSSHLSNEQHYEARVARRTSPPRWHQTSSRDERHKNDPGGRYEEYGHHDSSNKRRHRSSPHRSVRKHRHDRHGQSTQVTSHSKGHGSSLTHATPHNHSRPPSNPSSPQLEIDEIADVQSGYNSEDEHVGSKRPENLEDLELWFEAALKAKKGWIIKKMGDDGACLFRAVADQIYGDQEMHSIVRLAAVDYMAKNGDFFSQYVTEDFNEYLDRKRLDSCHGNHVEMQALSELYNRPIEVFQYSTEPINTFHGAYKTDNQPIRLSYHGNTHYNSVVDPYKATIGVGLGLPGLEPGLADKKQLVEAVNQSENIHLEQAMLEDKLRETDWEVTQETIEEQVARESYLQWLRDNEKRAKRQTSPRSASATCSSASECQNWWEANAGSPGRSPRNRSANNSAQNSPKRPDLADPAVSMTSGADVLPTTSVASLSPKQGTSQMSAMARCPTPEGAVGGACAFSETSSIMNELPNHMLGVNEWDEDDLLAQVIAQSQQEYLDSLKKNSQTASSSACSSSPAPTATVSSASFTNRPSTSAGCYGNAMPSSSSSSSSFDSMMYLPMNHDS